MCSYRFNTLCLNVKKIKDPLQKPKLVFLVDGIASGSTLNINVF